MTWEGREIQNGSTAEPVCEVVLLLFGFDPGQSEVRMRLSGSDTPESLNGMDRESLGIVLRRELDLALNELL